MAERRWLVHTQVGVPLLVESNAEVETAQCMHGDATDGLDIDFRRYRIFGACNPPFAHAALQKDPHVGVLLPCNVVLYEKDGGKAVVGAVDPLQTLGASGESGGLADLALEVGARLARALADLPS
jgi:uncharacterized protein (DUF302 family)